jgi:hypothetical protein
MFGSTATYLRHTIDPDELRISGELYTVITLKRETGRAKGPVQERVRCPFLSRAGQSKTAGPIIQLCWAGKPDYTRCTFRMIVKVRPPYGRVSTR